jgi:DNA invertase Pin-like site-specific DNA recombinase
MPTESQKFVAYLRVSTQKQGRSGLGLEGQRQAVLAFVASRGGEIIAPEFVEVESGRNNERPQLEKALKRCRVTRSTLVVAKLDRLSRNAVFLLKLQEGNVPLIAADMPDANEMTVGVMALVARQEAKAVSERTKAALAAAKVRRAAGGLPSLGGFRERAADIRLYQKEGVLARKVKAQQAAEENREDVEPLAREGLSLRKVADRLNESHSKPPRGGKWSAQAVKNLFVRLKIERPVYGCRNQWRATHEP